MKNTIAMWRVVGTLVLLGVAYFLVFRGGTGSSLFDAVESGDLDGVRASLHRNPKLIGSRREGLTLLHVAAEAGQTDVARYLVDAGLDVDAPGGRGDYSPLFNASVKCREGVADALLSAGANVNFRARDGETPLLVSVPRCPVRMVAFLLERGADANATDADHETPLELAAVSDNGPALVRTLLGHGAAVSDQLVAKLKHRRDEQGMSKSLEEVISLLEENNARPANVKSPLPPKPGPDEP